MIRLCTNTTTELQRKTFLLRVAEKGGTTRAKNPQWRKRHRMGGALPFHVQCFTVYSVFIWNLKARDVFIIMFCGAAAASLLCKSWRLKGVNIPNKR